ncbi:hypothetical protein BFW38_11900 [Terasakiispira papahanaumokuakeensis]|uniref:YheU family protein n=1 Tax=Terasakiispira papahanaumokuakeensis TaxID=197479 RepID=A0A1E2VB25_9GAMM|nr:YheU family protein [Terasakiispira papahanaumokuakeensis]ODC04123.1 hypothetical protein BFW38_11900 [Terasakiispira papahanaumokuakeensis]
MHQRFVAIADSLLAPETLAALLEAFVTRQGYDTADTSDAGIQGWVEEVKAQLKRGDLMIIHDIETESTEILPRDQAEAWLRGDYPLGADLTQPSDV